MGVKVRLMLTEDYIKSCGVFLHENYFGCKSICRKGAVKFPVTPARIIMLLQSMFR